MCIGVPVKIIEITDSEALVELDGVRQSVNIDLVPRVNKGEYVLLHAGCAIEKVNEKEAQRTLSLMKELSRGAVSNGRLML